MKKRIPIILLISLITITAYSQNQRQIFNKYFYNYPKSYSEQFQGIKKGHKIIKDGWYLRFKKSALVGIAVFEPALFQKGYYKNNQKDSVWEYFYNSIPYNTLRAKGSYRNNLKSGLWKYYYQPNKNGEFEIQSIQNKKRRLDTLLMNIHFKLKKLQRAAGVYRNGKKTGIWKYYLNGKLIIMLDYTSSKPLYFLGNSFATMSQDSIRPLFVGTKTMLDSILYNRLNMRMGYPRKGYVEIEFNVDKLGNTSEYKIKKRTTPKSFAKYVMKAVEEIPQFWVPGFYKRRAVPMKYSITVELAGKQKNNHYCVSFYQGYTHCFLFKYDNKRQP